MLFYSDRGPSKPPIIIGLVLCCAVDIHVRSRSKRNDQLTPTACAQQHPVSVVRDPACSNYPSSRAPASEAAKTTTPRHTPRLSTFVTSGGDDEENHGRSDAVGRTLPNKIVEMQQIQQRTPLHRVVGDASKAGTKRPPKTLHLPLTWYRDV